MRGVVSYTDYFVICTGRNPRQTSAIVDAVREKLKAERVLPQRVEGDREGDWVLLDYLDAIVHVFTPEARAFYRLENLWGQVPSETYATG
jgi:ribosome-associated protein